MTFIEDFENGIDDDLWYIEAPDDRVTISTKYHKSGKHSLRVELNKTDPNVEGSKRAEIRIDKANPISEGPLEEHTYTFYTFLPNGGSEDYKLDPEGSEIIAQWHNQPDENEEWTSPPLSLHTYNGDYIIQRFWDDAEITTEDKIKENFESINIGSYEEDKGKWVKWKFHVKWGWLVSQNPIIEIYKDDTLVLKCIGLPNTTNDKLGVVMKLGIYKWDWAQEGENNSSILSKRVIYYDYVSIS